MDSAKDIDQQKQKNTEIIKRTYVKNSKFKKLSVLLPQNNIATIKIKRLYEKIWKNERIEGNKVNKTVWPPSSTFYYLITSILISW